MDHDELCDCAFIARCETYQDRLIDAARKGPEGFGCRRQSNLYRGKHCHTFACAYLALVITDALHGPPPEAESRR